MLLPRPGLLLPALLCLLESRKNLFIVCASQPQREGDTDVVPSSIWATWEWVKVETGFLPLLY